MLAQTGRFLRTGQLWTKSRHGGKPSDQEWSDV